MKEKQNETQDLHLCVFKWMNLKQESSDVDKIYYKCPVAIVISVNSPNVWCLNYKM